MAFPGLRDATEQDLPQLLAIYGHEVLHGLATFEEEPPTLEEFTRRWQAVRDLGLPFILAEMDGVVAGYAYAALHRPRPAYRNTIENSVYLDRRWRRRGVGKALLNRLIETCEQGPWRQMVAVIGDSNNAGSIALHKSLGFRHVGTLRSVGFKLERWVDTVTMQRQLGEGDKSPPEAGHG